MFNKSERLTRAQFSTFFNSGKRYHVEHLSLIHVPHAHRHVAVVVSKKVQRKSHDRNRLRRRVYGQLYRRLTKAGATGVYIILLKPSFARLSKQKQLQEVQNLLNRVTMSR